MMQNYYQENSAIQYAGLKPEEIYAKIQSDAETKVRAYVEKFKQDLEQLELIATGKQKKTFLGYVSIPFSLLYSGVKGFFSSALDAINGINIILANLVNDIAWIFKDPENWDKHLGYAIANPFITFGEGILTTLVGTAATAGRFLGIDPKWAYGEHGEITKIADSANYTRAKVLKKGIRKGLTVDTSPDLSDFMLLGEARDIVDEHTFKETEQYIRGSLNVQKWIEKNAVEPFVDLVLGKAKERADLEFGNTKLYQMGVGTAESVGRILAAWTLAKLGAISGLSPGIISTSYFAASVFGQSFQEAYERGASMQDAYTYAVANTALETAIENVGGLTTTGVKTSKSSGLFTKLFGEKWGTFAKNVFEEAAEEVASEFMGTGYSKYSSGQVEYHKKFGDAMAEMGFAALSGALASGVLGGGRMMYLNTTMEAKMGDIANKFNKAVEKFGEEKAVKLVEKEMNNVLAILNDPKARGVKTNKKGHQYIGKLTTQEKLAFLRDNTFLNAAITEENGKFVFREKVQKGLTADMFKNRIGDKVVEKGVYAVSPEVYGVDLSDEGRVNVKKVSELSEAGKEVYEKIVKVAGFPLAIAYEDIEGGAFYVKNNDMVYINEKWLIEEAKKSPFGTPLKTVREYALKHELVHRIRNRHPELFKKIENQISQLVKMNINPETGTIIFEYKNDVVRDAVKEAGIEKQISRSAKYYLSRYANKTPTLKELEWVYDTLYEELSAYFIENIRTGDKFTDTILKSYTGWDKLSDKLQKKIFSGMKNDIIQDRESAKILKRIERSFMRAVREDIKRKKTIQFFLDHVAGIKVKELPAFVTKFFSKELLEEYNPLFIVNELLERENFIPGNPGQIREGADGPYIEGYEPPKYKIGGKIYTVDQIFNEDSGLHQLLKYIQERPKARLAEPDEDLIRKSFKFDASKTSDYIRALIELSEEYDYFLREWYAALPLMDTKDTNKKLMHEKYEQQREELGNLIDKAEDLVRKLRQHETLTDEEIDFLGDVYARKTYEEELEKYQASKRIYVPTDEASAVAAWCLRVKEFIRNHTGLNVRTLFPEGEIVTTFKIEKNEDEDAALEKVKNSLAFVLNAQYPGEYDFDDTVTIEDGEKIGTVFIYPLPQAIEKEMQGQRLAAEKKAMALAESQELFHDKIELETEAARGLGGQIKQFFQERKLSFPSNTNFIEINSQTTHQDLAKHKFDKNNVVIGVIGDEKKGVGIVNQAFKIAPIVVVAAPISWRSQYSTQSKIDNTAKLVLNEPLGVFSVDGKTAKLTAQIWVKNLFLDLQSDFGKKLYKISNIRLRQPRPTRSIDFETKTFQKYDPDIENMDFDFAVVYSGSAKTDFNQIYTKEELVKAPIGRIMLVKAKNDAALVALKALDYNEIARKGSFSDRYGFTIADLVEAYNQYKYDNFVKMRLAKGTLLELSEEEKQDIEKVFGSALSAIYRKDAKGNYILQSRHMREYAEAKKSIVSINGTLYGGDTYAIHTTRDFSESNIVVSPKSLKEGDTIVKLEELGTGKLRALFDLLVKMKISFVFFRGSVDKSGKIIKGFVPAGFAPNIAFYNIESPYLLVSIAETIVHELTHEIIKENDEDFLRELASSLASVFYEQQGKRTQLTSLGQVFGKEILNHLNRYTQGVTHEKVYDSLVGMRTNQQKSLAEEFVAFIIGKLFSDQQFMKKLFNSKLTNFEPLKLQNLFSKLMNDFRQTDPLATQILQNLFSAFNLHYEEYLKTIRKKYPTKKGFSLTEINGFIRDFTNNEYKTRKALFDAYFKEKMQKKRGPASQHLENVIFAASQLANITKRGVEMFKKIERDFTATMKTIEKIYDDPDAVFRIVNNDIQKMAKKIQEIITGQFGLLDSQRQEMLDTIKDTNELTEKLKELYKEVFLSEEFYDKLDEAFQEIAEQFEKIDSLILDMFDYPRLDELNALFKEITEAYSNADVSQLQESLKALKNFLDKIKKITRKTNTLLQRIALDQKAKRDTNIKHIVNVIKSKFNNAVATIKAHERQKVSPLNRNLRTIIAYVRGGEFKTKDMFTGEEVIFSTPGIIPTIEKNKFDLAKMAEELVPVLGELHSFVARNMENRDVFEQYLQPLFYALYGNFAVFFNDPAIIRKIIVNPSLLDPKVPLSAFATKFSEARVGSILAKILKAFATRYTTVFGGDVLTHEELSTLTVDQIRKLEEPVNFKGLNPVKDFFTPQDYFKMVAEILEGKVDFFKWFYDEYVKAAFRHTDILADFDRRYRKFNEENPKLQKHSLTKTDILPEYLVQMRSEELDIIKDRAKQKLEDMNTEIATIKKNIKEATEKRKKIIVELSKLRSEKGDPEEIKKKVAIKEKYDTRIEGLKTDLENKRIIRDTYDLDIEIRNEIYTYIQEHINDPDFAKRQQISRGQLIATYLSVCREIEMHEIAEKDPVESIFPTEHFRFGGEVRFFDNELMHKKGYEYAKERAVPFAILAESREKLRDYLASKLDENDWKIIEFARECFDKNYEYLNEIYKAKFGVDLPRQPTYIGYATINSDYTRQFQLKFAGAYNVGVADGMTLMTTEGATTTLRIEDIFGCIENHTNQTAKYSFERIITDFQNLLVNRASGTDFDAVVSGAGTKLGDDNNFKQFFEKSMVNILRYTEVGENKIAKISRDVIRRLTGATVALAIPMMFKQLASIPVIALRANINIIDLMKNIGLNLGKTKYFKWLLKKNSNFYFRVRQRGTSALAEQVDPGLLRRLDRKTRKIGDVLSAHITFTDAVILVGVFKTIVDKLLKENPGMTVEKAMEVANEGQFRDVLLFCVANTDTAFRTPLSNVRNPMVQTLTRFQGENFMHVSSILRFLFKMKNRVGGSKRELVIALIAMLMSGLYSALVSTTANNLRGYVSKEDWAFDFVVNEFIWGNVVGAIPIVNSFTSMLQFDKENIVRLGFEPRSPGLSELFDVFEKLVTMNDNNRWRNLVDIVATLTNLFGLPGKNAKRFVTTGARFFDTGEKNVANEVNRFFTLRTRQQEFALAVKENNRSKINNYVSEIFEDLRVRQEIVRLMIDNPDAKLNLYDIESFKKENEEGKLVEYKIPINVRDKYHRFAQKALRLLIRKTEYRRLSDAEKIKTIQRVINYYMNHMKDEVLGEVGEIAAIEKVVENALRYSK